MKTLFIALALSATALTATTQLAVAQSEKDVAAIKAVIEQKRVHARDPVSGKDGAARWVGQVENRPRRRGCLYARQIMA